MIELLVHSNWWRFLVENQTLQSILLDMGNIVMFLGTLLQIRAVIKDRNVIRGYHPLGSFLTFMGMMFFNTFYVTVQNWFSLGIALFTTAYWVLATTYSSRWIRKKYWRKFISLIKH